MDEWPLAVFCYCTRDYSWLWQECSLPSDQTYIITVLLTLPTEGGYGHIIYARGRRHILGGGPARTLYKQIWPISYLTGSPTPISALSTNCLTPQLHNRTPTAITIHSPPGPPIPHRNTHFYLFITFTSSHCISQTSWNLESNVPRSEVARSGD